MKTIQNFLLALCAMLMLWVPQGHAEDIDIYSGGAASGGAPNVLIILDNAASFSASEPLGCKYADGTNDDASMNGKVAAIQQCGLYNTIFSLATNTDGSAKVNLGLMLYNTTGLAAAYPLSGCTSSNNGGCLLRALTPMNAAGKASWLAMIRGWNIDDIKANAQGNGLAMQEAWAYYAGSIGASGRNYSSIVPGAGCQKNFVIYIGTAFRNNTSPGDSGDVSGMLAAAPPLSNRTATPNPDTTPIVIPSGTYGLPADPKRIVNPAGFACGFGNPYSMGQHGNPSGLYADEWARYMNMTDLYGSFDERQGITTYTIGVLGATCKADYPALLSSMASVGGGKYFAADASDVGSVADAIQQVLNEIQSVNSVFASASLPVSVNSEGTYLNQIFLGMFRPDPSAAPRWVGNLKQFQLVRIPATSTTGPVVLGDALGFPAISSAGTGFIKPSSVSFWTSKNTSIEPDSSGGFFKNNPLGTSSNATELAALAFDSADGEVVEKGGAAQQIRKAILTSTYPSTGRKVYTYCPSGVGCVSTLSDTSNAFTVANTAVLAATPALSPSTITRSGQVATVTTPSPHGLVAGDSVLIAGALPSSFYSGTKTVKAPVTPTTFAFDVDEYPPVTATGSYTYSVSAGVPKTLTLTRVGTTVTANSTAHGFLDLDTISISGADQPEYTGNFQISAVTPNTFQFQVVLTPPLLAGGGTAVRESGNAAARAPRIIESIGNGGVIRVAGSTTVTVKTVAPHLYSANQKITIAGVTDSGGNSVYNGSNININLIFNANTFTFTTTIGPATPATGTITALKVVTPLAITTLTRAGAVATATVAAHLLPDGTMVQIGGTAGPNEGAYLGGPFAISGVTPTSFDYPVVTSPPSSATGTITVSKAGTSDRTALINWVRGADNFGDESGPGGSVTVRPSVHGDVLHSRPVVINYQEGNVALSTTDKLVVYYGSNDGHFRAINGSQTDSIGAVPPGGELWSLILPEHFAKLDRQRQNLPELAIPPSAPPGSLSKDYFVDGSAGVFQKLKADGTIDKAYLYLTMRRGGRFIYALDVTDPVDPKFLWRRGSTDTGFAELGQTWSRPRITLVNGYADPVLIFAAGYDPAEDAEPPTVGTIGRGLFVLDAVTGNIIWKATGTADVAASCVTVAAVGPVPEHSHCKVPEMKYAMPSDIAFKDRDSDNYTDRVYVGDLGGNLWRADFVTSTDGTSANKSSTPANWRITRIAALGCATGACSLGTTPRKFFYAPSVISVGATGVSGSYDAVVAASGDREHPLLSAAAGSAHLVRNRFYMVKDVISSAFPKRSTTNLAAIDTDTIVPPMPLRTEATLFTSYSTTPLTAGTHQRVTADVMTITIPLAAPDHGFNVGQTVVIDGATPQLLDGHFTITATTNRTFSFTSAGLPGASAAITSGSATVTKVTSASISSFARVTKDYMTITTEAAHGFVKGQTVTITGANPSSLDGQFAITSTPTTTTFTYKSLGAVTASAAASGEASVSTFSSARPEPGFVGYLALGEKAVNAPVTVSGTAFFGTNRPVAPSPTTCVANLGQARGYAFSPFGSSFTSTVYDGGGLPPSAVAGVVNLGTNSNPDFVRFCIGCGGGGGGGGGANSPLENADPFLAVPKKPQRTYWYRR